MARETSPAIPASFGARQAMPTDLLEKALSDIDLDKMVEQLSGRLDGRGQTAFAEKAAEDRSRVAALAAEFAGSDHFRPLFDWMLDITIRRPVSIWGLGDQRQEYVDRREGGNAVMWQFLAAVAEGRGEEPPAVEGARL